MEYAQMNAINAARFQKILKGEGLPEQKPQQEKDRDKGRER
jgi:hypothetical protein